MRKSILVEVFAIVYKKYILPFCLFTFEISYQHNSPNIVVFKDMFLSLPNYDYVFCSNVKYALVSNSKIRFLLIIILL